MTATTNKLPDRLDINKTIADVYDSYEENGANNIGAMICGLPLIGKTSLIGTAPGPTIVYSFDPKGLIVLRDEIRSGKVLPFRYWNDDADKPFAWKNFSDDIEKHIDLGLFEKINSVALDSATFMLQAAENQVVKIDGPQGYENKPRKNNIPFRSDYRVIARIVVDLLKRLASQNVNIFVTVHLRPQTDDEGNLIGYDLNMIPSLRNLFAGIFTETWVLIAEGKDPKTSKPKRVLLTDPWGRYTVAGSQLSKHGILALKEEPNIAQIMKKAGLSWQEKPNLR